MYLSENGQTKQELLIQQQNSASTNGTSVSATNASSGTNASATGVNQPTTTENSTQSSSVSAAGKFHKQTTSPSSQLPSLSSNSAGLIVLHPSLESSNYIIKSLWLPGSQTELALITSEFIKIYDLSIDKISPVFYYLLPIGKIKDVTFVYDTHSDLETCSSSPLNNENLPADAVFKQSKYIVIMSSCGYMFFEEMNDVTSAKNGVYYITNTIEFQYEPPCHPVLHKQLLARTLLHHQLHLPLLVLNQMRQPSPVIICLVVVSRCIIRLNWVCFSGVISRENLLLERLKVIRLPWIKYCH